MREKKEGGRVGVVDLDADECFSFYDLAIAQSVKETPKNICLWKKKSINR